MNECDVRVLARIPLPDGLMGGSDYQFVITLEPMNLDKGAEHRPSPVVLDAPRRQSQAFTILWGTQRDEILVKLLQKFRQPRYRLLDSVIAEIQNSAKKSAFDEFVSRYEDPRQLAGGQVHFQICLETQEFLQKMSWGLADGNRSKVARAAMEFVCR